MTPGFKPYGLDYSFCPTGLQTIEIKKKFAAEFMKMAQSGASYSLCIAHAACEVWRAGRRFQHDEEC